MSDPLVSVILPTYNRAYILGEAINSVLAQTYKNWELIIVDDGSTDNTAELVKSYKDKRIKYFQKKNAGPCAARNYGISKAKGKWITYLELIANLQPSANR